MTGELGRAEFEAVAGAIRASIEHLRDDAGSLVPRPLCEAYRQAEAQRVEALERAVAEVRAEMERRSSSRTQAVAGIAVALLALLGSIGAALISLLN